MGFRMINQARTCCVDLSFSLNRIESNKTWFNVSSSFIHCIKFSGAFVHLIDGMLTSFLIFFFAASF